MSLGLWYNGITHDSGSCNGGSIPPSPTRKKQSRVLGIVFCLIINSYITQYSNQSLF